MKRTALLVIPAVALALAVLPPPRPNLSRVYMPVFPNVPAWMRATALPPRTETPRPPAGPTPVSDWRQLEKNLLTPGAHVVADAVEFRPSRVLHMARGVTLDAAGARLLDRGLYLNKAHGSTIRGLVVTAVTGDGIQVSGSRDVLIEGVHVSRTGDGGIDVVEGPTDGREAWVTIRDSVIADTNKGSLIGDQDQPQDALLRVRLVRVRFIRIRERGPKVQRATVWIEGGRVEHWIGTAVDARLNATIHLSGTSFQAAKGSAAHLQTSGGGRIIEGKGNSYTPWAGAE